MEKGDLVLGYKVDPVLGTVFGIIINVEDLEEGPKGPKAFITVSWHDGIISHEFSDDVRPFYD